MKIISAIFLLIFWQYSFAQQTYKIPVVVHVMHLGEPEGTGTNVSTIKIKAAIDTLNKIFAGTFLNGSIPTNISFELASRSPNNICTNGITRTNLSTNIIYAASGVRINNITNPFCGIEELTLKSNRWNPDKYLNIWLVNKIQFGIICEDYGGYTSFPNYDSLRDGIVLNYAFVSNPGSSIQGNTTLAHEVGHYLNLYHVFEGSSDIFTCPSNSNNCNLDNDKICDTRPTTINRNLPRRIGSNDCDNNNPYEEYTERNLMSYTTEPFIFTPDQSERMTNYIQNNSHRQILSINNDAIVPPIADLLITEQTNYQYQVLQNTTTNILAKFKETNNSSSPVSGNRVVSFHLSQDNILTPGSNGDIFLSDTTISYNLAAQSSSNLLQKILSIPSTLAVGQYYLFISADALNNVNECIEDNNFASAILYVTNPQAVASYKYWFDDDFANAVTGFGGFSANNYISSEISVNNLTNGVHQLNIIFKELGAGWSSISSSLFYKQQINVQGAAKYQYWFDNDFSSVITKNISSVNNYNLIQNIQLPNTLTVGQHAIHFRFKIEGGFWSVVTSSLFNYGGVLPLKLLSFTANNSNCNTIALNWETTNEVNFDRFIIQQSTDGINFIDINSINSNISSNPTKKYSFIVPHLQNETYFYRLKQIDRDGSYSYSSILKQKIICNKSKYSISPNPTKSGFTISSLDNKQITVMLCSINGQRIKIWERQSSNIYSLKDFPNGLYILKIEDEFFKIIKQ